MTARSGPIAPPRAARTDDYLPLVGRLRALAFERLPEMFQPEDGLFVFRVKRDGDRTHAEGLSRRYTAIVLIGLASESHTAPIAGRSLPEICADLVRSAPDDEGIGDRALVAWAAEVTSCPDAPRAWDRLLAANPATTPCPVVELSWALSALCHRAEARLRTCADAVAERLMSCYAEAAHVFPHNAGGGTLRTHVACFADQVYPILALSHYFAVSKHTGALAMAVQTARHISESQGDAGQWWWHYDARTGAAVEGYPVYSVHQHAMAPMALRALEVVSGTDFGEPIARGLAWLASSPELDGASLVEADGRTMWRKVARREPSKASRYLQALASRVHHRARWPGLDALFPPVAIDFEYRPYEFGWLLYAWSPRGAAARPAGAERG